MLLLDWIDLRQPERTLFLRSPLSKSAGGSALFNTQEAEVFPARRTREQFEKYFVPGFTILLFLAQAAAGWWLWRGLNQAPAPTAGGNALMLASVQGLGALLLFMLGKYVSGVVRLEQNRLLRPVAGYLLLNAYLFAVVVGTAIATQLEYPKVDLIVARILSGVICLVAAETLIGLVMEAYRPRVKGREVRLLFDSRLVGVLSQPEGVVTTLAHALDYQFGFNVSETWFYRFLEKSLAAIIILQVALLLLSTTFVIIDPGEQALLERCGQPVATRP